MAARTNRKAHGRPDTRPDNENATLTPQRPGNGQVWVGADVAPWVSGHYPGRMACRRCLASVDALALSDAASFIWEHLGCGRK